MSEEEWRDVLAALKGGATLTVPIRTRLFPETEALRSTLVQSGNDAFALTTFFREFAAGHGWSCEQSETVYLDLEHLASRLRGQPRDSVSVV